MSRSTPWIFTLCAALWLAAPEPAWAVYQCGNVKDDCQCGANNPYPCCDNGSNCTWWAWEAACCHWGVGLPGWGNANTWASYASKNGNYQVLGYPVPGSIATSTKGGYGHVAWVESVSGNKIVVSEMNCCGSCPYGKRTWSYDKSYFNSGYVVQKGQPPPGPVCPNGSCEGGENCANCPQDCGGCCGNGACDNGENCSSCAKDCGGCCGNGACDFGETCATCSKDCICLPQGALEKATCSQISGWVKDPDTPATVPVTLIDNGKSLATTKADLPHPTHDGYGFWWATPKAMKDNAVHAITVQAADDAHPQLATLGPSEFICNNGPLPSDAWQTLQVDHAGCGVQVPDGDGWVVRHHHEAGFKLPLAGVLSSCLTPLPGGFIEGFADLSWSFGAMPFAAAVRLDGAHLGNWTGNGETRVQFGPGMTLCLDTLALQEVPVGVQTESLLGPVWVRQGPWWWVATSHERGWRGAAVPPDGLEFTSDSEVVGGLRATLGVGQPFDELTWNVSELKLPAGANVRVRTGTFEFAVDDRGPQDHAGLWGQELAVQVAVPALTAVVDPVQVRIDHLRARQNVERKQGPWTIAQHGSYGLYADASPTDALPGLDLALLHRDSAWWTTGKLQATAHVTYDQVDAIKARIAGAFPEPGLEVRLDVAGVPVWQLAGGAPLPSVLEVNLPRPATDGTLSWTIAALQDRWHGQDGMVRLYGLQWRSRGWWTTPSFDLQGWRDRRVAGGGVRIEAGALLLAGKLAVQLPLPFVAKGVRLHYQQDLRPVEAEAEILFDGKLAHSVHAVGLYERDLDLPGPATVVTVQVVTHGDLVGLADATTPTDTESPRWVEVSGVEVQAPDGQWIKASDLATWHAGGLSADATGTAASAKPSDEASDGGCSSSPSGTGGSWLLMLLCGGVAVVLRRARRTD